MKIEIIYIPVAAEAYHVHVDCEMGLTVHEVLERSNVFHLHPETRQFSIGIFSKKVDLATPVKEGDRIEIYRPLQNDPKEKRREKAKRNR